MIDPKDFPEPPQPLGAYRACVAREGRVATLSGQFPALEDSAYMGAIGEALTTYQAKRAAILAADNCLAHIAARFHEDWSSFKGLLHVAGYLRTTPEFSEHAVVLDAASDRFVEVLGDEAGSHSRSVIGVCSLPNRICIELVVSFAVDR